MAFVDSEVEDGAHAVQDALSVKIVVAGGFGVGKTTFVGAVSEIEPLRTEALMTEASTPVDDLSMLPTKTTTTVAMDYMEQRGVPFICALNAFDGIQHHTINDVRDALQLGPDTPFIITDARNRQAVKQVLVNLVEHAMTIA